jgi:hypothetical protein
MTERLVADPSRFALSPDRLEGQFRLLSTVDHADSFEIGDHPLLLLPVRLETRFAGSTLQLRIYPSQLHVDDHDTRLTTREIALGTAYWERRLTAAEAGAARDDLVRQLDARRAVYVARQTRPIWRPKERDWVYPDLKPRRKGKAAQAALLPDHWCAVGFVGNVRAFVAWGRDVRAPLHCAPDLADLVPYDGGDGALPVDDGMAWMVDFDRAVEDGMAMSIDLSGVDLGDEGLTLLVVGVRGADDDDKELVSLLEAHYYSDGLDVLAQGTPTNNTDEAVAGWTPDVADVAALFARELDGAGVASATGSGAAQLATALGLEDDTVLRRLPGAVADEDAAMEAMNRALWPVSWGRYLSDLLAPEGGPPILSIGKHIALRDFFAGYVRGGAPLPTLAIGPHPFGLLPIVRRDTADLQAVDPLAALEGVLLALRERWRESLPGVARLDPVGVVNDETAVEVLGLVPHPRRLVVRRLNYERDARVIFWRWMWDEVAKGDLSWLASLESGDSTVRGLGELDSVEEEISWIQTWQNMPSPGTPDEQQRADDFLQVVIDLCNEHLDRQTPINEWYPDAISGVYDDDVTTDPKLFWSSYDTPDVDRLFTRPLVAAPDHEPADYLPALARRGRQRTAAAGAPLLEQLVAAVVDDVPGDQAAGYAAALRTLSERSPEELELRLRETLGLAAHRLDAWITGLASQALADRRAGGDRTLRVGGFGWVEGLAPDADGTRPSTGFVHAPSLEHAATAAVLRAGWTAHGADDPANAFAVDLRSERVRTAAYLLDGVRRGGALGDLLGCRFERRLHDDHLDAFIDACRRRVLEAQGITRAPRGPVDGLALADLYDDGGVRVDAPDGASFTIVADVRERAPTRAGLQAALDDLLGSLDAVADATLADAVHHVLQGNGERAAATLEGIATGAVPPPDLSGLRTPATGASVSHRVLVTLAPRAATAPGWGDSPRARLEPGLAAWAASLLGDPAAAACTVQVTATGESVRLSLADLAVSPLDAVFEDLATWRRRACAHVLNQSQYSGYEDGLVVADDDSLAELADLASALRAVCASARPLDARDLALPGSVTESGADVAEADARLNAFRNDLDAAVATLEPLLAGDDGDLAAIRAAVAPLAGFGIRSAVPVRGYAEAGRGRLLADARSALATAKGRLSAASPIEPGLPLLPRFAATGRTFLRALDAGERLVADDRATAMGWLDGVARVRSHVGALEEAITLAELLADAAIAPPLVGQLGVGADEPWVALNAPADRRRGAQSFLVLDHGGRRALAGDGVAAGLVVDEWVETVPTGDVVTAVALNVDAPSSRPPQSMLLGLPDGTWDFNAVVDTLLEALEAAKLRAVDPDVLAAYGHQAPAIFPPTGLDCGPQEQADG